jgi:TonB family protein
MKNRIIAPILLLLAIAGFSQDINYDVRGKYKHPATKDKLNDARSMSDLIPYYPASWITSYISTEILVTEDGNALRAAGINETLSADQISLLGSAGFGADIEININYLTRDFTTADSENRTMNYSATVIPDTEAEFPDGYQQLKQYLKETAIDKISDKDAEQLEFAVVRFTVNEDGGIANAQVSRTSGDPLIDELLLEAISKMPRWSAAEDSNGIKVSQEFEFTVQGGSVGC